MTICTACKGTGGRWNNCLQTYIRRYNCIECKGSGRAKRGIEGAHSQTPLQRDILESANTSHKHAVAGDEKGRQDQQDTAK